MPRYSDEWPEADTENIHPHETYHFLSTFTNQEAPPVFLLDCS